MEIICAIVVLLGSIFGIYSYRHHLRVKAFLLSPIKTENYIVDQIGKIVQFDDAIIAGLTLFDVIYTAIKINPDVLAKFKHIDYKESVSKITDLVSNAQSSAPVSEVVGNSVQVDTSFHTDMSIYTPGESMALFADNPVDTIQTTTSGVDIPDISLHDSGLDLADYNSLFFQIPIFAITIKSVKNWQKVSTKQFTVPEAIEHTIVDSAALSATAITGTAIGGKAGLLLAPLTGGISLVVGPVLGTILGLFGGKSLINAYREWRYGDDFKAARIRYQRVETILTSNVVCFRNDFLNSFGRITTLLKSIHEQNLLSIESRLETNEKWFKRIFFPNAFSKSLQMSINEAKKEFRTSTLPYYQKLNDELKKIPERDGGLLLYGQGKSRLMKLDFLESRFDIISEGIRELQSARDEYIYEKALFENKVR